MESPMAASIRTVSRVANAAGEGGAESHPFLLSDLPCDLTLSPSDVAVELYAGEGCMLGCGADIVLLVLVKTVGNIWDEQHP